MQAETDVLKPCTDRPMIYITDCCDYYSAITAVIKSMFLCYVLLMVLKNSTSDIIFSNNINVARC